MDICNKISRILYTHQHVFECYVKKTRTNNSTSLFIAYLVPTSFLNEEELLDFLKQRFPDFLGELRFSFLTSIPKDHQGQVCHEKLLYMPVCSYLSPFIKDKFNEIQIQNATETEIEAFQLDAKIKAQVDSTHAMSNVAYRKLKPSLLDYLENTRLNFPNKGITFIGLDDSELFLSYSDLYNQAVKISNNLSSYQYPPETPVILQMSSNVEFICAFWGILMSGYTPAPVGVSKQYNDEDAISLRLLNTLSSLPGSVILTSEDLFEKIYNYLELKQILTSKILVFSHLQRGSEVKKVDFNKERQTAIYLQTSGSTSAPKMVPQSHEHIIKRTLAAISFNSFKSSDVVLNCFPLDHVCGIVMCHIKNMVLGAQEIIAPVQLFLRKPYLWLDWCNKYRVNVTWAPNFAFNLINSYKNKLDDFKWDLSCLDFIENCAESVVPSQCLQFIKNLKKFGLRSDVVKPSWGMSETCSVSVLSNFFDPVNVSADDTICSLGEPYAGLSLRVVDNNNEVVNEGVAGRLQVKGDYVLEGYFNNPKANLESFTDDRWFDTGDVAVIENKQLALLGRDKDVVIVNGNNIGGYEIEAVVDKLNGVEPSFTAAVPLRLPEEATDSLAIFFSSHLEGDELGHLISNIRVSVAMQFGITPAFLIKLPQEKILKTAVGKIQKSALKKQLLNNEIDESYIIRSKSLNTLSSIPSCFYEPKWQKTPESEVKREADFPFLIIGKAQGAVDEIKDAFFNLQLNHDVYFVNDGLEYCQHGDNLFTINQCESRDYLKLFKYLFEKHSKVNLVLCCESLFNSHSGKNLNNLDFKVLNRIICAAKFIALNKDYFDRVCVLSCLNSYVPGYQNTFDLNESPVNSLFRSLSEEVRSSQFKVVDLDVEACKDLSKIVIAEISDPQPIRNICYRNGIRLSRKLKQTSKPKETGSRLISKVSYIVTGGLGGIGQKIIASLLERFDIYLIVVGSTPEQLLEPKKLDFLKQIKEDYPQKLSYIDVDLSDKNKILSMKSKLKDIAPYPIYGIFHLAGNYCEESLSNSNPNTLFLEENKVKVLGSYYLFQLALELNLKLFVNFSSINAFFGGARVAGYSMSNEFQSSLAYFADCHNLSIDILNLRWSQWSDLGMSEGKRYEKILESRGYQSFASEKGLELFYHALSAQSSDLVIGISGNHIRLSEDVVINSAPRKILEWVKGSVGEDESIKDELGNLIPMRENAASKNADVEENKITTKPIDNPSLSKLLKDKSNNCFKHEELLVKIWSEVLDLPSISYEDNIFDIGGDSISLHRVSELLNQSLNTEIDLLFFYQYPSIKKFAQYLDGITN